MSEEYSYVDKEPGQVEFSYPCRGNYGWRRINIWCEEKTRNHGHVLYDGDDGFSLVRFCVHSRLGAASIVGRLVRKRYISEEVGEALLADPAVLKLPFDLTEEERQALSESDSNEVFMRGFWAEG